MSNSISTSGSVHHTDSDPECRARAYAYLVELIGARPETLTWDSTHCLQGHAHVGQRDLVVIAPRDATHRPIVMTEPGWDAVRRSIADQRHRTHPGLRHHRPCEPGVSPRVRRVASAGSRRLTGRLSHPIPSSVRMIDSASGTARLSMMNPPISGRCEAAFSAVRDAFAGNFAERGEVGGAVCVIVDGQVVVDLVGGWADQACTRPWQPDTLVNFYSVGKAFVALLALQLVDAGLIGLDDPIAAIWPEFGALGKENATVRHALCHRAGVPAIRERLTNDRSVGLGTHDGGTGGHRSRGGNRAPDTRTTPTRTATSSVRSFDASPATCPGHDFGDIAEPLDADVWCGVPAGEQHRCAEVIWAPAAAIGEVDFAALSGEALMIALGYFNPPGYSSAGVVNIGRMAWRPGPVDERARLGRRSGPSVRRAARARPAALARAARRSDQTTVARVLPGARRGCHVRPRVQADRASPSFRSEPAELRSLRHRRRGRIRRSRRRRRVRLCDEPRHPEMAELAQPSADRRCLPVRSEPSSTGSSCKPSSLARSASRRGTRIR